MKLTYKDINISYSDKGEGKTIIFLHGFLENKGMWDFFTAHFSKSYRVITIDLLGHGDTGCLGYIHTMEDMADAVHAVLQKIKVKKAAFIGHSMGGYVSLAMAELYPDTVEAVVLQNSTSYPDSEERKLNRDRAIKAVKQSYTNFVRMSIANLFSEDNRERLAAEIEAVKEEALKTPLQGIVAALEGMKIRKSREVILHTATFPIMLVLGKKDPVMNYQENITQAKDTNVKLVTYPDGHMAHIEDRDVLMKDLEGFLHSLQ